MGALSTSTSIIRRLQPSMIAHTARDCLVFLLSSILMQLILTQECGHCDGNPVMAIERYRLAHPDYSPPTHQAGLIGALRTFCGQLERHKDLAQICPLCP